MSKLATICLMMVFVLLGSTAAWAWFGRGGAVANPALFTDNSGDLFTDNSGNLFVQQ